MFIAWLSLLSLHSKYFIVTNIYLKKNKKIKGQVQIVFCSEP